MRLYLPTLLPLPLLPLSTPLTLPSSFGTIHFGSPFTCYISVLSPTGTPLECTLTVKLQTPSSRLPLTQIKHTLTPSSPLETTLNHTLTLPGSHTLRVLLEYSSGLVLRKFYKFTVLKPFSLKSRTHILKTSTLAEITTTSHLPTTSLCELRFTSLTPHTLPP
ncbi:hypothetical protein TL16_g02015 [Triparma laevis f. inornata]|uniref:Trafficking protein particle complex subunit 13 N-terminal domain-containing protein n=1 Tax=Triparma laevis f. inornata TaxID=1714386 RepID=A0A9W7DTP8_9STRA|nr:hypothetical protein TL16_g02015 [Triparma laevis f. inornata]